MGIIQSRPKSGIILHIWSCTDVISSISRIHMASSRVIFTYHFKHYHACDYNTFAMYVNRYVTIYNEPKKRRDRFNALVNLRFHSMTACSTDLYYGPWLAPCLLRCSTLTVTNIKMLREISNVYTSNISSETSEIPLRGLGIEHLGIPADTHYLPSTLESLVIGRIHSYSDLDLSKLIHLRKLTIRTVHAYAGIGILNILLPDNLEQLTIPPEIFGAIKLPSLILLSCGNNDDVMDTSSLVSPTYFQNTNIKQLCLCGFSTLWWSQFEFPSNLEILECQYRNLRHICKRIAILPKCSLSYIIITMMMIPTLMFGRKPILIRAWVCNDKIKYEKLYKQHDEPGHEWFMLTLDEFRSTRIECIEVEYSMLNSYKI
jgi:hypothetical protein